jgi:DNA (cytosine-5)-methyltransferase 1
LVASETEILKVSTFPQDYNWSGKDLWFLCGMSVAPLMSAQIAYQIYKQWLKKIND